MKEGVQNLEVKCAELGEKLAGKASEKVLNEALAVLEEQGVYAAFLYLRARHGNIAGELLSACQAFLRDVFPLTKEDPLETAKELAQNLDNLLFARELLRTAFAYARYHVKAKGE